MKFGEKLAICRKQANMTQKELGERIGVSARSIINYEVNGSYPKKREVYTKISEVLNIDINYLLTEDEEFVLDAGEMYGTKGKSDAKYILAQTSALFAGGELNEKDKDAFFKTITEIYFDSKEKAKKYTPNKYRKEE
ncbi:MAG: helix-turn-helix domain-containing protein [Anaerotignaceae bacterium]